jgi:hypothetical protein
MFNTKEFNETLDTFYDKLFEILQLYQNIIPILKKELDCILKDDIKVLNECLKSLQALSLQTKGFDKMTAEFLSELKIPAKNLTQMIPHLPEDKQPEFYSLLGQFQSTLKEVDFYKEKCNVILQTKLYTVEKKLSILTEQKGIKIYNHDGKGTEGTLLSKSFETTI